MSIIKALGLIGFIRFIKEYKRQVNTATKRDWSRLKTKGISQANLNLIIKKIVMSKVLADKLGLEEAFRLRNRLSDKIAYDVLEEVFAPAKVFMACGKGDFLKAFKEYYSALCRAMDRAGLESGEIVKDTEDEFQLNITYCAWCEVAKTLGNAYLCYYATCYGDEVFFPKLCEDTGFEFTRTGTLTTGNSACDMKFSRI